jgi:opacity protein-like surface antigen
MKRISTIGACLIAVLAVSAIAVASAAAAPPELGRCLKVAPVEEGKKKTFHGLYGGKSCTSLSLKKNGHYEWAPGPGEKNKFAGIDVELEPTLETVGGAKVSCSSYETHGEYTGPTKLKVSKILLSGCATAGKPCQTVPVTESVIESGGELEGELGVIANKGTPKETVGWDLKREGIMFAFTCGKLPELASTQTVEGSFIGPVGPGAESNLNRMSIHSLIKYKEKAGKQLPEAFEGGAKDTLTTTTITGTAKTVEQTGLITDENVTSGLGEPIEKEVNQEPLEIRTKP